jgi:hypothetical protein
MKIEINNHYAADGKEFYYWTLYDGPDDIDEAKGFAVDLIEAMSKILEWRERIARDYNNDTNNNETD